MPSIDSLTGSRALALYGLFSLATAVLAAAWALFKLSYQRGAGRPLPRNAFTITMDVLVDFAQNVAGAINRGLKLSGSAGLFLATQPALAPVEPPSAPPLDPVAPPLPTPAEPLPVLRAPTLTGRETVVPEVSQEHYESVRDGANRVLGIDRSQRGHVAVRALLAIVVGLSVIVPVGIALTGCPPPPPSDGGVPVVTPSDWTRTARLSVTIGRGLIVVARPIVETLAVDPGRTRARRAFDAADQALAGLDRALVAYEARGGDRCVAYAATGAAIVTLHELAQVLADNGIALGVPLARVVDLVASVADTLIPACQSDAGFASVGGRSDATLRAIETAARARGVILRRDLDGIAPALDGGL